MADAQQRGGQRGRFAQTTDLQPRAHGHQAQRQGGQTHAVQAGAHGFGQLQAAEVGQQAGQRAQDQRVARQLAQIRLTAVACQRPHRCHIAKRHAQRDQQRHRGDRAGAAEPLSQRQRDERVETKCGLSARRMQSRVEPRPPADGV